MADDVHAACKMAISELQGVAQRLNVAQMQHFASAIVAAQKIAVHGLGREGLQMKGLGMRLYHLGFNAHVVGEMTLPPLGRGDLLMVSAGPGDFASIQALVDIARKAGAGIAVVTAQPRSKLARNADALLVIPAQTMADDEHEKASILPMGSLYEMGMMLIFEILVLHLRNLKRETPETMRARHTNIE